MNNIQKAAEKCFKEDDSFTEWVKKIYVDSVTHYLNEMKQQGDNPHLLREDGGKKPQLEKKKSCDVACSPSDYYKGGKCDKHGCYEEAPRPEQKEDWTELVEKMFSRYPKISRSGMRAALTEGMQEAYEMGSKGLSKWGDVEDLWDSMKILQQQLVEKDKKMETWKQKYIEMSNAVSGEYRDMVLKYESELTAAKEQLAEKDELTRLDKEQKSKWWQEKQTLQSELTAAKAMIQILESQIEDYARIMQRIAEQENK